MTSSGTAGWLDERDQHAWQVFFEMQDLFWRRMAQSLSREAGLSEPDFVVLTVLSEAPGGRLRAYELSAVAQMEKTRLHHHLNRMVQRGLLTRPADVDGRVAVFEITATGRAAFGRAAPIRAAHVRRWLLDRLDDDQVVALEEISQAVLAGLRT
ncbi:MarR family winged helix-turn-helix transcriptional regulator [Jiangella endophytica]|uniref:MarR family winged helix-turn-helix transcriptional regulator n=1 Tax=Jiangella endophytica TaxID=1623398 RepID=UPI000E352217|nr:MarR family winged helix-turn-helix transcriptional regulator [Jiangella endophytica]